VLFTPSRVEVSHIIAICKITPISQKVRAVNGADLREILTKINNEEAHSEKCAWGNHGHPS